MNIVKNQQTTAVPRELQAAKPGKSKVDTTETAQAFAGELMQAQTAPVVSAQGQMQAQQLAAQAKTEKAIVPVPNAGAQALSEGGVGAKSPLTRESTTSLNTASAIAGLKPWSGEWVFEGMQKPAANGQQPAQVKPLLDSLLEKNPNAPLAAPQGKDIEQMLQSLQGSRGEAGVAQSAQAGHAAVAENDASILGQLAALNGSIEGINVADDMEAAGPKKPNAGATSLSGGEFLNTLGAVKGMQQNAGSQGQGFGQEGGRESRSGLKLIEGGLKGEEVKAGKKMGFDEAMIAPVMTQSPNQATNPLPPVTMTGHVVKGRMSQDRLSSESLSGMTTSIRDLSAQGAGEMRVRLNPGNLGELTVKVSTKNGQVGLQIQASDESAKKVLEESMSHLKESLAVQNLTLGAVDVSVVGSAKSAGSEMNQDFGQNQNQNQQATQDMLGRNGGQSFGQSNSSHEGRESDPGGVRTMSPRAQAAMARVSSDARSSASSYNGVGRLDVRA